MKEHPKREISYTEGKEDPALESIIGQICISEYHGKRYIEELIQKPKMYVHAAAGYFYYPKSDKSKMHSVEVFKLKDRIYKVSVRIDEICPR